MEISIFKARSQLTVNPKKMPHLLSEEKVFNVYLKDTNFNELSFTLQSMPIPSLSNQYH